VVYFKCNVRRLVDYPNIRQYMRDVYQLPGMAESIDMEHIKTHYFTYVHAAAVHLSITVL
jgi:putative glutathione S-transferase